MTQLSRPYQIALLALAFLVLVWFVALRGHPSTSSSAGASSASSSATPAASTSTPAASTQSVGASERATATAPSAAAQAKAAAAPTHVYHGAAPGVEGLTRAVDKAHGAVAQSQSDAKRFEGANAEASGTNGAGTSTSNASGAGSAASSSSRSATANATPQVPSQGKPATPASAQGLPTMQTHVEAALKEGKIAVVLFWNPKGADDVAVHDELRLLKAAHHLIQPVAGTPAVRRALKRLGLELQGKIAVFEAPSSKVASFGSFTRAVQVYQTPTLLIVNAHGQTTTITGLTDAYSIEQAIDEARHS